MIAGEVGKPVPADMLPRFSPLLPVEGIWDSTSSLSLRLKESADASAICFDEGRNWDDDASPLTKSGAVPKKA